MDSQESKPVKCLTEHFRSIYPNVSIQQLGDKGSSKVAQSVEKRSPVKTPQKPVVSPKAVNIKLPTLPKTPTNSPKTQATNLNLKHSAGVTPKTITPTQAKVAVAAKQQAVTRSPVTIKTPPQAINKSRMATPVQQKNTVPISQVAKPTVTPGKAPAVRPPAPAAVLKTVPQKGTPMKVQQNVVKQQTAVMNKISNPTPAAKEDVPDQSSPTAVPYQMPQVTQRTSNQVTIEKIDQQQRIPVVFDSNNQVLVANAPVVTLQSRVAPADASQVQSVTIQQKKWKGIRSSYSRELLKRKTHKSGSGASSRKQYVYFDQLGFLETCSKKTSSSINVEADEYVNLAEDDDDPDDPKSPNNSANNDSVQPKKKRKRASKNDDDELIHVLKTKVAQEQSDNNDEDKLFLLSLLSEIKKVPPQNKLLLRSNIASAIAVAQQPTVQQHW